MKNEVTGSINGLEIYTILTIRSASVVGNAKAIGVGLLGSVSIFIFIYIYIYL
jgi:hypothetical protein